MNAIVRGEMGGAGGAKGKREGGSRLAQGEGEGAPALRREPWMAARFGAAALPPL